MRRWSTVDISERLLAVAVAALPGHRREWGLAMLAELAEVQGSSARRRFALSSVRATVLLRPAGGWPALVLVVATVAAAATAAGFTVGAAVPGLTVFAVTFTVLVGAIAIRAVARSRRVRLPAPAPTVLVAVGVVASIAAAVHFLRREPDAARYLPAPAAVYLAAVLAGCVWIAVTSPRWLGSGRLAPHVGVVGAVALTSWSLLSYRLEQTEPALPMVVLLGFVLVSTPFAVFSVPAFVAGRAGRSRLSGVQASVWTVIAAMPLTFALWLPEALRRHAIDGRTLDGELVAPVGVNLEGALFFCLGILPLFGFAVGAAGASVGARRGLRAAPDQLQP